MLVNSYGPKISFWAILEVLNFEFSKFEQLPSSKFTKNSKFRVSKIAKNDIFGLFDYAKIFFQVKINKIIKFQQSQALNSHFESFWSIVSLHMMNTLFVGNDTPCADRTFDLERHWAHINCLKGQR